MTEGSLIFPIEEFQNRTVRLQERMSDEGLDALLLTTPADVFYATGFLTRFWESPARPWFVVVPRRGAPVAVIPRIGADLMGRTWITDIRTWDAPNPHDDGVGLLGDTLKELTPNAARIGMPSGLETHVRMPLADLERLRATLRDRLIVDGTDALHRVREIKSDAEVAKIKTSCVIADRAFARVSEYARAGAPLDHIFRQFQMALLDEGADWVSYVAGAAAQGGYGDVISPATTAPLAPGDVLMLDTGAVKDGYFCDFNRNFSVGDIDDAVARTHDALWEATGVALLDLKPGARACDVHKMMCDALAARGLTPGGGRLGHGLGVTLTEWPSFTPLDTTELRAGMVLTLEPSAEVSPGKILVHEENIVLREDGPELLSARAPCEMPVLAS
ncbi:MAG: Xaa-Pro peptidase family protein [Marinovum sp.]|nr:Xaa-Pro peptidase family protein [Marinovum sp.]